MKKLLRRLRGAVGIGLVWAAVGFGIGMTILLIVGPDAADVPFPLGFALLGFLAGLTFAGVVAIAGRQRHLDQMSVPRFALLGGAAGLLFSAGFVALSGVGWSMMGVLGPVFGVLGAGSGAGVLAMARAGDRAGDRHAPLSDAEKPPELE